MDFYCLLWINYKSDAAAHQIEFVKNETEKLQERLSITIGSV